MRAIKPLTRGLLRQQTIFGSSPSLRARSFGTTSLLQARNRIYDNIRNQTDFDDQLLSSASSRTALITAWTASWCPSCKIVTPIIRELIEQGAGEEEGGVSFAEVEFDSPTIGEAAGRYAITSIPTLMAFSRQEAQLQTRLMNVNEMKDRELLRLWIADEARRGGSGGQGGGSGFLGNIFGVNR